MPSGSIFYCSREDQIYPGFAKCLAQLAQKHPDAKVDWIVTNDIAKGRNQAVLSAEGDWLWFIDTDQMFASNTLERLLAHGVDIVQTLCLKRHPPHEPIVWEHDSVEMNTGLSGRPRLVKVKSLGAGGTLYRRHVFEQIRGPWFEGILGTEDTNFAAKAMSAGFDLHVDLTTPVGHTTPMVVWPDRVDGQWAIRYDAMNGDRLHLPMPDDGRIVQPPGLALVR